MIHTLHAVLRAIAATAEPLPKPSGSLSPEVHKSTCLQPQACVFQFFLDLLGGGIRRFPCSQPACAQGPRLLPTSCVLVLRTRIERTQPAASGRAQGTQSLLRLSAAFPRPDRHSNPGNQSSQLKLRLQFSADTR